jgi:HK97 family phage portal protein
MKIGFLKKLKSVFNQATWDEMIRAFLSGADFPTGNDINVSGSESLKFSAVFACMRVLAETFASVPVSEYRKISDGEREKTDDTGLYDILHNTPNDEMSSYNFKEMSMYQINTGGNLVCLKTKNRGGISSLYPFEWHRVEIKRNRDTLKLEYKIDGKDSLVYDRSQVFHVPGPSLNGIIGMSPIEYAAQAIRLGLTYEKFGINFYKNGAIPSGIFQHPGSLKDDAYKRLKEELRNNYQNLSNAGVPLLLEDNMQFQQLTMRLADAQLLECKKFQIEDICRIFRVPQHLVNQLDRATFSNIEHQSLEFIMYTMLPHFKRWEDCINTQLLTPAQRKAGYYFEFNISALLRGDAKSMAEAFAVGRQWGWLSVNDIRRMLNMNPIENGDVYLQPMNMIEAGQEVEETKKEIVDELYKLIEKSRV